MLFTDLAQFQPKQKEAWYTLMDPQCKYLLYGGAAAGGKSYWLRWSAIGLGMYYYAKYGIKHVPIGLFSEDYPTLKDRQVIRIKHEIPASIGRLIESRDEGYAFIANKEYGEFTVLLRNLDDPSKYASAEFAAIGVEEITKNNKDTIDDLRFRLRYPGISDVKFFAATNPGGKGHGPVKRLWVKPDMSEPDVEQDRFFYVPAKYSDNKFIDPTYVKQLEALPETKRKAFMEGDWDIFAGQFFSVWRDSLHVCTPFIPNKRDSILIGGMDWGRAKPFSFHLATVTKVTSEDGVTFHRVRTFMEAYGTERTPSEWSDLIIERMKRFNLTLDDISWIEGDPAMWTKQNDGSISIRDQFVKADDGWRKLRPGSNDRVGGWENMQNWLTLAPDGLPYYQATSNCYNLIRTIPELVYDENKVEDVDTDSEDHAGDEQRYMLKRLKWIDAKLGGIGKTGIKKKLQKTALIDMQTGKQVSIDMSKFERKVKGSKPFYK